MPRLKAVLFDFYGTLVDIHTEDHKETVFEAMSRFLEYRRVFVPARTLQELFFIQINLQLAASREKQPEVDVVKAFSQVMKECGQTIDRHLAMLVTQLYRALSRQKFHLFEDTFWTLNEFRKQYRLGIVSDAQRVFCKPELRSLRLENFFDAVIISSDYGFRKPDPRLFHIALAALDVSASAAAYIGNKYETDLIGGKAAGLARVGLIHQSEEETRHYQGGYEPDFVLPHLQAAFEDLRTWSGKHDTNQDKQDKKEESNEDMAR